MVNLPPEGPTLGGREVISSVNGIVTAWSAVAMKLVRNGTWGGVSDITAAG